MLIVVLFGFLNIKSVKIYIYLLNNTIIVQVRYIIIETKEFSRIGYNGFLFPHSYSGDVPRPLPEYSCGKRNKGDCVRIVYIGGIDDHHCLNVFLIKESKNINTTTQNNLKNIILISVNNKYIF